MKDKYFHNETFEERPILSKYKEGEKFNRQIH